MNSSQPGAASGGGLRGLRARVLPVHLDVGETEGGVGAHGGDVVLVDVEHDPVEAELAQVVQAQHRDGTAQSLALPVGGDRHDVDLADVPARWVDLRPVRGREDVRGVRLDDEDEPGWVPPRLGHPLVEVGPPQRPLLRVVRERGGVEGQPGVLVTSGLEGADGIPRVQRGRRPGGSVAQGSAHDVERAHGHEAVGAGEGGRHVGCRTRRVAPDAHAVRQAREQGAPHARPPGHGRDDELSRGRSLARARLGVADERATGVGREQVVDPVVLARADREAELLRQRR